MGILVRGLSAAVATPKKTKTEEEMTVPSSRLPQASCEYVAAVVKDSVCRFVLMLYWRGMHLVTNPEFGVYGRCRIKQTRMRVQCS